MNRLSSTHILSLSQGLVLLTLSKMAIAVESSTISAEDLLFEDIPSVYSASKYDQKVTKAPASISIVTADEIKKWGYRTFGDLLSSLKGFYHTNDRSYGHVGARGFGTQTDYNTRLLLLIDGHRFNDNIFEGFDSTEAFPLDIDNIERVEVVRGPSSSLYGSSADLGVINVISKRGRDQAGSSVKSSYGSNDAYKTSLSFGDRFKNGLEAFVSGTFYHSQGFNLYYPEFDTADNNNGLAAGRDGAESKQLMAKAAFGDFTLQAVYSNREKDVPTAPYKTLFNFPLSTQNQYTFVDLKYDHTFSNQLNVQARLSYNNTRMRGQYPYNFGGEKNFDLNFNHDLAAGQWVRAELEGSRLFWQAHRLTFGGQFQQNFQQFQTNFDLVTNLFVDAKTYQGAGFVQDDYAITDNLSLNAGLRLDYYSIFGSSLNPRLGLIYTPWQSSTFKLLYGTAFRAPNQYELNYYGSSSGNGFLPPALRPEKLETVELILEHYFTAQLRAEVNLYHTNISDIINLVAINDTTSQQQNTGKVDSNGIELQIENNWLNGWQGRASYAWQHSLNQSEGGLLANSPQHMFKLNVIAPLWQDKLFLGFETQYLSTRSVTQNRGIVPGYVVSNLTVFSQNFIKGVELSGGLYNLFDERYADPAPDNYIQNTIPQDPLTFRLKASVNF